MIVPGSGRIEELSLRQRERALEYLLGKLYVKFQTEFEQALDETSCEPKDPSATLQLPQIGANGNYWDPVGVPVNYHPLWKPDHSLQKQASMHPNPLLSTGIQTQVTRTHAGFSAELRY